MKPPRATRMLFLDDSGHPAPNHASGAVVIGGVAVQSSSIPVLSRRIAGVKGRLFKARGHPASWELKSANTIRPNEWRRQRNQALVQEVFKIIDELDCITYTASIDKAKMRHPMTQRTTMPLQLQALVEHFAVECAHRGEIGVLVMDRSDHGLDAHASRCVASYASSHRLPLHPTVYYADSTTSAAIQVADLITGIQRRAVEGDDAMQLLDTGVGATLLQTLGRRRTHRGRRWTNHIVVF